MSDYIVTSGLYADTEYKQKFYSYWEANVLRQYPAAKAIYVLDAASPNKPLVVSPKVQIVSSVGNLGHVERILQLPEADRPDYCGCSIAFLFGALMAYNCQCDWVYQESDCLAFGPWEDFFSTSEATGLWTSHPTLNVEHSLVRVKKEALLEFIRLYVSILNRDDQLLPERKFHVMEHHLGVVHYPYGVGRQRPLTVESPQWFAQQINPAELAEIELAGLLP